MPTVQFEPNLYRQIELIAQEEETNAQEIFSKALRHYVWELNRRKISQESERYRQLHSQIKEKYLGQYIAMRHGQIVDHDNEFEVLRKRVYHRFGSEPILITLVREKIDLELKRCGVRLGDGSWVLF